MNNVSENNSFLSEFMTSARVVMLTMLICCVLYPLLILAVGQVLTPFSANGSLIKNEQGVIIGSELLAQAFTRQEYFWPRPSAADYNASAACGSNLSPTSSKLKARVQDILNKMARVDNMPIPADLVTTSGSGMDPHITLQAALYQAERVASARGLPVKAVTELFVSEPLVNVLLVNLKLDKMGK